MNPGPLAGLTILRFAHAFESGGGTERYLDDLDRALLARNAMTIVRLRLTRNPTGDPPAEEQIGMGTLVHIPLPVLPGNNSPAADDEGTLRNRLKRVVRVRVLNNPLVWRLAGARWVAGRQLRPEPGQAVGAGIAAAEIIRQRHIDLAVLHFFGGADADEVVDALRRAGIPFAILNHYSNDRFLHLAIRKHAMLANGIAGVNGLDVPPYLRERFCNLSDGIDTEFFRRKHARPLPKVPAQPIVLLPARVVREKGHWDLVRAIAQVRKSGVDCCIGFAGRVDASGFVDELQREIDRAGLTNRVYFLGNLTVEELRDWYAASAVMAFPTYHHEGLGRAIIEASAMEIPVVAYATGGVPEAIESGGTGFLLPTGDVTGLANRLGELLASSSLRASMGAHGRKLAETRFSLAALADRHERFYRRIIGASATSPVPSTG